MPRRFALTLALAALAAAAGCKTTPDKPAPTGPPFAELRLTFDT